MSYKLAMNNLTPITVEDVKKEHYSIFQFKFKLRNGEYEFYLQQVPVNQNPQIVPAAGCDLVVGGNSTSSKNFVNIKPELVYVDFPRKPEEQVDAWGYVIEEDIETLKVNFKSLCAKVLHARANELQKQMEELSIQLGAN